jgi:hypothetical protein
MSPPKKELMSIPKSRNCPRWTSGFAMDDDKNCIRTDPVGISSLIKKINCKNRWSCRYHNALDQQSAKVNQEIVYDGRGLLIFVAKESDADWIEF